MNSELRVGDILVFKSGDDWVGKSIAWITKSDVSHAAMVYEDGSILEMGLHGISCSAIQVSPGEGAYHLRLDPEQNTLPLHDAGKVYLEAETRYDFPALVILAGLLVYREIRPTPKLVAITDLILRAACTFLDGLLQRVIAHNPDKAMVCSQLVYQIYNDCAGDYRIRLKDGLLQAECTTPDTIRLIDFAQNALEPMDMISTLTDPSMDTESLAKALCEALEEQSNGALMLDRAELGNNLPTWVKCFVSKLEEFLEKTKSDLPLDALFVTPADLVNKALNLTMLGMLDVKHD